MHHWCPTQCPLFENDIWYYDLDYDGIYNYPEYDDYYDKVRSPPQEPYLCQFSTNLEMVNCELGPTFGAEFQDMWKMSWCEVTKFGLECHWRCFLEIAKGWNVDIPLERGNPYDSNGATYVRIRGILREIWPFYGKLPEMESLCAGHSGKDSWHRLKRRRSALFIREFNWINLHSQRWYFLKFLSKFNVRSFKE